MVEQNYIMYVNAKRDLRTAKVTITEGASIRFQFHIPEKHLICGLILKGIPFKGHLLKDFPFKPIEKYLFEFSNIHFTIPDLEYTVENTSYDFELALPAGVFSVEFNTIYS